MSPIVRGALPPEIQAVLDEAERLQGEIDDIAASCDAIGVKIDQVGKGMMKVGANAVRLGNTFGSAAPVQIGAAVAVAGLIATAVSGSVARWQEEQKLKAILPKKQEYARAKMEVLGRLLPRLDANVQRLADWLRREATHAISIDVVDRDPLVRRGLLALYDAHLKLSGSVALAGWMRGEFAAWLQGQHKSTQSAFDAGRAVLNSQRILLSSSSAGSMASGSLPIGMLFLVRDAEVHPEVRSDERFRDFVRDLAWRRFWNALAPWSSRAKQTRALLEQCVAGSVHVKGTLQTITAFAVAVVLLPVMGFGMTQYGSPGADTAATVAALPGESEDGSSRAVPPVAASLSTSGSDEYNPSPFERPPQHNEPVPPPPTTAIPPVAAVPQAVEPTPSAPPPEAPSDEPAQVEREAPAAETSERLMPSSVTASSFISNGRRQHAPEVAFDGDPATAWNENDRGPGDGSWIAAHFGRPVVINRLRITTGYDHLSAHHGDLFPLNSHLRRVRITFDGRHPIERDVGEDERELIVDNLRVRARSVRIDALEVWPGTRWEDLCIGEIVIESPPTPLDVGDPGQATARADSPAVAGSTRGTDARCSYLTRGTFHLRATATAGREGTEEVDTLPSVEVQQAGALRRGGERMFYVRLLDGSDREGWMFIPVRDLGEGCPN